MARLDGKTALVTGGAGGMGEAHVRRFVAEGARVYFVDMLAEQGEALAQELGDAVTFSVADVTSETDWQRIVAEAEALYGPVHILVNNAGIVLRDPIETMSEAVYRKVIDVNQLSVFLGMKAIVPSMRRAGSGSIINISSICGFVGRPETVAYTASKFAVRGMTKVAAVELAVDNIRANSVHPGAIITPMFEAMAQSVRDELAGETPLGRLAAASEITNLVLFLASDEASYCTGSEFVADGGMLAS